MIRSIKIKIIKNFFDHQYISSKLCYKFKYYNSKNKNFRANIIRNKLIKKYGIYIGFNTKIEEGLKFPHPSSIIIGDKVKIGKKCTIYQNVTIGKKKGNLDRASGYPIIKDNVTIFSNACIIGDITIGEGAIIGANSVILEDVAKNSVYAGIPGKKIK